MGQDSGDAGGEEEEADSVAEVPALVPVARPHAQRPSVHPLTNTRPLSVHVVI